MATLKDSLRLLIFLSVVYSSLSLRMATPVKETTADDPRRTRIEITIQDDVLRESQDGPNKYPADYVKSKTAEIIITEDQVLYRGGDVKVSAKKPRGMIINNADTIIKIDSGIPGDKLKSNGFIVIDDIDWRTEADPTQKPAIEKKG